MRPSGQNSTTQQGGNRVVQFSRIGSSRKVSSRTQSKRTIGSPISQKSSTRGVQETASRGLQGMISKLIKLRFFSLQHTSRVARINTHFENKKKRKKETLTKSPRL
jgi:hypothetical protein